MTRIKRSITAAGLVGALISMLICAPLVVAQEHAPPVVIAAAAAPAHGEAQGGEHGQIDQRLVPIPPSRDTIVSAIWVLVIFLAMLAILYPTAWKNVLAGLKKREERIRNDIAEAEAARARAETTLREYNTKLSAAEDQIRQMLTNATTEGEKIATNIRMKAQADAEEIKERANKEIEATREAAVRDFRKYAAEVATSAAEKIIRRNLNAADQQDLVRESLEQLQTVK
jgi:F-type H+-transporting ATPase subunit b